MNKQTKWLTRTALLLALALLFQSLRSVLPKVMIPVIGELDQYVIGSLVNTVLILAAVTVGLSGGIAISILTPVIALMQGEIAFPVMTPFVALGNIALVVFVAILYKKSKITSFVTGIIAKFITLYLTINFIVIPIITPELPAERAGVVSALLSFKFGYPQIITATIGSIIAFSLIPILEKILKENFSYKNSKLR